MNWGSAADVVSAPAAEDDVVVGKNSSGLSVRYRWPMRCSTLAELTQLRSASSPRAVICRREAVVARGSLQHDQTRRRGRTAIDHMNMFRRIKGVPEEGRCPWLIPVDGAICLAQHIIVPPIHIDVRGIRLADIDRRIDKVWWGSWCWSGDRAAPAAQPCQAARPRSPLTGPGRRSLTSMPTPARCAASCSRRSRRTDCCRHWQNGPTLRDRRHTGCWLC